MDIKRKKILKLVGIFVIILILINVIEGIQKINQVNVDDCINNYFKEQQIEAEAGKVKIFSYEQLENSRFGMLINQYSLVRSDVYIGDECRTIVYPMRFKIISFLGFNKIISCSSASDGEENSENYKKIFPESVIDKLNESYDEYNQKLEEESKDKFEKLNK